jgi:hypothetical protein
MMDPRRPTNQEEETWGFESIPIQGVRIMMGDDGGMLRMLIVGLCSQLIHSFPGESSSSGSSSWFISVLVAVS